MWDGGKKVGSRKSKMVRDGSRFYIKYDNTLKCALNGDIYSGFLDFPVLILCNPWDLKIIILFVCLMWGEECKEDELETLIVLNLRGSPQVLCEISCSRRMRKTNYAVNSDFKKTY